MNPQQKRFVKYAFDQRNGSKPKQGFKQRESSSNAGTRSKRYVSYTEKSSIKQNVLKDMINSYVVVKKPSKEVVQICKSYSKYFNTVPKEPQSISTQLLNNYLVVLKRRPVFQKKEHIQQQSEQQPDWDSESDHENGIQSRRIDKQLIDKVHQKLGAMKLPRSDQLKRHQRQFLQDHIRQKHLQQVAQQQKLAKQKQIKQAEQKEAEWTEYQEKQVTQFVNMGFIQKIQQNQQEQDGFGSQDFSVEDQKSQKSDKKQSSDQDDDIFGDQGPTKIVKKQDARDSDKTQKLNTGHQTSNHGTVLISNHLFSQIAQKAGIPPAACIWIIKNKNQRYKVSTQFMDEMYRLNNFSQSLPYISLNHSEFIHNNDVQKEKGFDILKNFNARRHQYTNNNQQYKKYRQNHNQNQNPVQSRNGAYENKQKFQAKPQQKAHLNKK